MTDLNKAAILDALCEGRIKWDFEFLDPQLQRIREALGINPPWYVGPGTQFWTFVVADERLELVEVAKKLEIDSLGPEDYVWQVAVKLALREMEG